MAVTVEIEGVGRVEFDDSFRDLPPDQQEAAVNEVRQQAGVEAPQAQAAQSPLGKVAGAVGDAALGMGRQFTGGFNERLGSLAAGMADVDPIEGGLGMAGQALGFDPPRTPIRMTADALRSERMAGPAPRTATERVIRRGGEVLGETLPVAGGLFGLARAGVGAGINAAASSGSTGQRAAASVLDTIRAAPAASAAVERTGAVGAGLGGGLAREVAPGNAPAELAAEVAGGIAAPLATAYGSPALAARGARAGLRAVTSRFTEAGQGQRAADFVSGRLKGELSGDFARENLERGAKVREQIPGFEPSLAQESRVPSLATTQEALERKASGTDLDEAISRHAANRDAVERFRQQNAPQGEPDAEAALSPLVEDRAAAGRQLRTMEAERERIDRLRKDAAEFVREQKAAVGQGATASSIDRAEEAARIDTAMRALNDQERSMLQAFDAKLIQERMDLAQGVRPNYIVDRKLLGGRIRNELLAERKARSDEMSRLAQDLGVNDADMAVPFERFNQAVADWQSSIRLPTQRQNMPDTMRDVQALAERAEPVTFQDIKALRESITDELIDLARDTRPGSRKRLANGAQLKSMIDDILLNTELEGVDPVLAANYRQFRERYLTDFIKPFEQGMALEAKRTDGAGFYRTLDEEVAAEFLSSQEAARQFREVLGDNRQAIGDLMAVALDDLADTAIRDGAIVQRGLGQWITRHRGALQELPELKAVTDRLKQDVDSAFEQHRLATESLNQRVATERQRLVAADEGTRYGRIEDRRGREAQMREIDEQFRLQDDELRAAQQQLDEALTPLRERMGLLTERKMAREDQVLARRVAAVEGGQKTADDVVREALQKPKMMFNLTARLGGEPEAMAALRRKIWDDLAPMNGEQLETFIAANEASLKHVFSKRHLDNLRTVAEALKMLDVVPAPARGQAIGTDVVEDIRRATGFNPMQASSRFVNIQSGRLSARVAGFDFLMRALNARRAGLGDKLMREALYNPQVAEALLSRMPVDAKGKPSRVITAWLATQGILYPSEASNGR